MKNITIIGDNRPGLLADIADLLANAGINIESMDAETAGQMGVVSLTASDYDLAMERLRDADYQVLSEDAMVLKLEDKPGALARVAAKFKEKNVDIRSMRLLKREGDHCLVSLVAEKTPQVMELVKDSLVA
ncbi:MAG: ACT domain-containing protein [Alphaproteobacteria bacterium]|nr:ACT domain-containing protein [Alphaproteobacteria bacterium]